VVGWRCRPHGENITAATDLDDELRGWLAAAYALAG